MSESSTINAELHPSADRSKRLAHVLELLAVLVLGTAVMHFIESGPDNPPGLPGHDSFYHVKMAQLLPEIGFTKTFRWLPFTVFTEGFVSNHCGFHLYLAPFVHYAEQWTGDPMAGGRWAISFAFGLGAMMFQGILISLKVPHRWLWALLYISLPTGFFGRLAYVRAMAPSLALMLALTWLIFTRRYVWMVFLIIFFTFIYLGAVTYVPIFVALSFAAAVLDPSRRRIPWSLPILGVVGWLAGMLLYPYGPKTTLPFLWTQVFETGLTPGVSVGSEWGAYNNVWFFVTMIATPLVALCIAILLRLRSSHPVNDIDIASLLISAAFFVLLAKARRFIEYWPVFGLLSAAVISAPVLRDWATEKWAARRPAAWCGIALITIGWCIGVSYFAPENLGNETVVQWWWVWLIPAGIFLLARWVSRDINRASVVPALATTAAVVMIFISLTGRQTEYMRKDVRCGFDIPAMQAALDYVAERSEEGDIIFTDDWDIFPPYFYCNHWNNYIVGLDPVFLYRKSPELYERFVRITKGQIPRTVEVNYPDDDPRHGEKIDVAAEDIRDIFGAKWIIIDSDHNSMRVRVERSDMVDAPEFITPPELSKQRNVTYRVYRVKPASPTDSHAASTAEPQT